MDQAVMDRMRAAGFKLAGGMWGECFWKVLAPGLVASIAANPEGCSPPSRRERGVRAPSLCACRPRRGEVVR
jgi:hypothetical protein